MIVQATSHLEQPSVPQTDQELTCLRHVQRWEQEGELTAAAITRSLDHAPGEEFGWSMSDVNEKSIAGETFVQLCNGGRGLSLDQFTDFYQDILDTQQPHVRTALGAVHKMLLFWAHFPFEARVSESAAECMDKAAFLRSLGIHAELNRFFNTAHIGQPFSVVHQRNNVHGVKVEEGTPPRTAWDLRRVLFRTLASPIPGRHVNDSMKVPVLHFVSHEHTTDEDGADSLIEHRVFELEDERTTHLLDLLGLTGCYVKHRCLGTANSLPFLRETFKTVPEKLPHIKHDLRQLAVDKSELVALITVLNPIDPFQEMVALDPDSPPWQSTQQQIIEYLAPCGDLVEWDDFDELIRVHVPHFYVQLSKVIGLLVSGRPAREDIELELHQDWRWGSYRAGEHLPTSLDVFTADERFHSRELPETLFVNGAVEMPLWHCARCKNDFGMDGYKATWSGYRGKSPDTMPVASKRKRARQQRSYPPRKSSPQTRTIMTRSRTEAKKAASG